MDGEIRRITLGEAADLITGFPFKSAAFTDAPDHVRLLRGDNVVQGRTRWDGAKRWPRDDLSEYNEYLLHPGDVVLAMDRPWIEAGLKHATLTEADCPSLLVQRVARLRAKSGLDQRFLGYVIRSADFSDYIRGVQTGTAVPHISSGQIRAYEFTVPTLKQQMRAGDLLGSLDDKIELNRRTIQTLEATVQELFKSWFVDFDPVHAKTGAQPTGLSDDLAALFPDRFGDDGLPSGWRISSIQQACNAIFSGGTPSTTNPEFWGGPIPWLSSGETRSHFIAGTEKTITVEAVHCSSTRLAKAGSTVIASAGQGQTRGQTSMLLLDTYINQSVVALEADHEVCSDAFLYFDLERRYSEFRQLSDGQSSRGSLTTKLLAGVRTIRPPRNVVEAFDAVAAPIIVKIGTLTHESNLLAELRDVLLPKLISGELPIADGKNQTVAA